MKIYELIQLLQECNQEATVIVLTKKQYSPYTWDDETVDASGILPWPEPKETADQIEITY